MSDETDRDTLRAEVAEAREAIASAETALARVYDVPESDISGRYAILALALLSLEGAREHVLTAASAARRLFP